VWFTTSCEGFSKGDAPGSFVSVAGVETHYTIEGPEDGIPVLLIHGILSPGSELYRSLASELRKDGRFRVLIPDLPGRGWSSHPHVHMTRHFFVTHLASLVYRLGFAQSQPMYILGSSMGGPIAAEFAASHPDRVAHLFLLAPGGFAASVPGAAPDAGLLSNIIQRAPFLPGLSRVLAFAYGMAAEGFTRKGLPDTADPALIAQKTAISLRYGREVAPCFGRTVVSTLRHFDMDLDNLLDQVYRRLPQDGANVDILWGEEDRVVPALNARLIRSVLPRASVTTYPGVHHDIAEEKSETVAARIIQLANEQQGGR
jgi:pimeloyl-ACP methyl ester carboxylesterase